MMGRAASMPLKVLIIDDSAYECRRLSELLEHAANTIVVGYCVDGLEALKQIDFHAPDVLTLDLRLPKRSGVDVIQHVMSLCPRPILVCSSSDEIREVGMEALDRMGVVDVMVKPSPEALPADREAFETGFREKVLRASRIRVIRRCGQRGQPPPASTQLPVAAAKSDPEASPAVPAPIPSVIAIGSSTGGPGTLLKLFEGVDATQFPPILIAQHLPFRFTQVLAEQMDDASRFLCREAEEGVLLSKGAIYICPGGMNMVLDAQFRIRLKKPDKLQAYTPSVDVLFESVAAAAKHHSWGIVLTGMGTDGVNGAKMIRECGGLVIAQGEKTSVVFGMPKACIEQGHASLILETGPLNALLMQLGRAAALKTLS